MSELGGQVVSAARWSLLNTVVIRVGTFATGVVLARYFLSPRDWGLYAVGLLILAVLLSANEMGVSLALVRWEREVRSFAPTVLTLSTAASLLLYAVLYVTAPVLARLLGSPDAVGVLRVLSLAVVIDGIACVPAGGLTRRFAQRERMRVDLANFLVSTAVTVVLAATGFRAMSFAYGAVSGNLVALFGYALAEPGMLRFGWDREQARALLRFGLPLAGASLLVLAMLNVDSAVIGAVLGPTALGLYQIAFNVSSWPVRAVSETARRVSFAGFSRLAGSDSTLADGFGRGLRLLTAAAIPACVLLGVLAEPLIRTVYGAQWVPAAGPLRFLAALGLLRVGFELAYDCLSAVGRRRELLLVQGAWLVALVPVLVLLAHRYGITGVGVGHVLVAGLVALPAFLVALTRARVPVRVVVDAVGTPVLGGIVCGVLAWSTYRLLGTGAVSLFAAGTAGLAGYALVLLPTVRAWRRTRRGSAPPVPVHAEEATQGA